MTEREQLFLYILVWVFTWLLFFKCIVITIWSAMLEHHKPHENPFLQNLLARHIDILLLVWLILRWMDRHYKVYLCFLTTSYHGNMCISLAVLCWLHATRVIALVGLGFFSFKQHLVPVWFLTPFCWSVKSDCWNDDCSWWLSRVVSQGVCTTLLPSLHPAGCTTDHWLCKDTN